MNQGNHEVRPPPSAEPAYTFRADAFTPAKTHRIVRDGLAIDDSSGSARLITWNEIVAVDLTAAATRHADNRHLCRLRLRGGERLDIISCSYESFANFRDQAADFNGFVRALHETLATRSENTVRYGREESPWAKRGRQLLAAGLIASLATLTTVMIVRGFPRWMLVAKILAVAATLPALWRWLRRDPGGRYDPRAISASRLPEETPRDEATGRGSVASEKKRWGRWFLAGVALWFLWVEWHPAGRAWPADLAEPEGVEVLHALPAGRDFLISGRVEPLPENSA